MADAFHDFLSHLLSRDGSGTDVSETLLLAVGTVALVLLAIAANWIARQVIVRGLSAVVRRSPVKWDDALLKTGVFTRLSHIAPALIIRLLGPTVWADYDPVLKAVDAAVSIYVAVIWMSVISALINALVSLASVSDWGARMPVKGFAQAAKLVVFLLGGIFIISVLLGKSPLYLLSGLGALTAVFLLVFRDALLGFTAGIMLSANRMVRIGDWIEMPKAGADGDVIDVTLTTVKVRNWDKTITTIPAYSLISDSFKNWRGMEETGGRRIKRALSIDMQSVRFASEEQIERWKRIRILRPYLDEKLREVKAANEVEADADLPVLANGRRLTNLGTFRAYCIAYLRNHPKIRRDLTFLVRQLAPTEHGVPIEIYVFTNDIRWANYEAIQADIFDHLLAVAGEFDLNPYQAPGGRDLRAALAAAKA